MFSLYKDSLYNRLCTQELIIVVGIIQICNLIPCLILWKWWMEKYLIIQIKTFYNLSIGIPCWPANEINNMQRTTKYLSHQSLVHIICSTSFAVNCCTNFEQFLTGWFNTSIWSSICRYYFVHLVLEYFDKTIVCFTLIVFTWY